MASCAKLSHNIQLYLNINSKINDIVVSKAAGEIFKTAVRHDAEKRCGERLM